MYTQTRILVVSNKNLPSLKAIAGILLLKNKIQFLGSKWALSINVCFHTQKHILVKAFWRLPISHVT
jgi:hypothetical protein